jgi:two-component system, chemotaxis family, chemotaxis protein CheY
MAGAAHSRSLLYNYAGGLSFASTEITMGSRIPPTPVPVKRTGEFGPETGRERSGRPVVLVVDDDWDICDAVKEVLDDAGFSAVCVENGARALEYVSGEPAPVAILLDLFMPVMDGWTFADRVRAVPHLQEIPLIVMTASGPHWGYPTPRVLRKPIYRNELIAAVRKAITPPGSASARL